MFASKLNYLPERACIRVKPPPKVTIYTILAFVCLIALIARMFLTEGGETVIRFFVQQKCVHAPV